jgi:PAS domain S-box-containing protein
LGYAKEELLGLHASDIHPAEEQESLRAAFEDIVGKGRSLYEHRVLRKDGSTTSVEVAGTLFEYRGRQVALGIFRDLAERKQAELTHAKLSRALEQTADSVMITDARGVIEYVNPEFEKTTGYGRDEVIGMTPSILKSGRISREFYDRLWEELLGGKVFRAVLLNRKKDGSLFYEDMTVSPLRDERGRVSHFISVSRDVTANRRAEEERLARERVHRDTLVREVHHRIKNHLQGLSGLLRQHATERPELREHLEAVIAQIHSVAVVHGLQGTAGRSDVRLCDMTEAICRAAKALSGGRVELQLEMDLEAPVSLAPEEAVSVALILNEMIVNAIKHGDHAAGPVRVRVIGGGRRGEVVVINPATALDFDAGGGGAGLTLVRALLPRVGAEFAVEATPDGCVEARLGVSSPVVVESRGEALGGDNPGVEGVAKAEPER